MKTLTPQHLSNLYKGGTVTLSAGEWHVEKPILVHGAKGWALRGHGARIVGPMEFKACELFNIEGITFDGGRQGEPTSRAMTLRVTACEDFRIERCDWVNAQLDPLYVSDGTHDGVFSDCEFTDAWRNAVSITNGHHLTFERPVIRNVRGTRPMAGIDVEPNADDPAPTDITIIDPDISDVGGYGILAPKMDATGNNPKRIVVRGGSVAGGIVLHGDEHEIESVRVDGLTAIRGWRPRVTGCDSTGRIHVAGPENVVRDNRSPLPVTVEDAI